MGLKYPIEKYARKSMMVPTLQDGIFKLKHLLTNELFKWKKTRMSWGR
jgi:hypothetical protein